MDKDVIAKEIKHLDTKKAVHQDDIPVKILKLIMIYFVSICHKFQRKY